MATNGEVYKAWTPAYRDPQNARTAAAPPKESTLRVQSGLKLQVEERVEELKKDQDAAPKVRLQELGGSYLDCKN